MKSTRAFKILSIALAAAVVFYFLVQGVRYLTNPYATTRVYTSTTEESVEASGWLVREEEAFRSEAGTLSHTRDEGEKVGKGQVIATAYDSPGALEAVAQIQAKRLQLEQLEYALSSYLNPDAALKLDGSISDEIMTLRKNLTGGDYTAASGDLSQLKAAIVKRSRAYTSSQEIKTEIAAVQDEIDSLQAGLTGATDITAPRAGTYSAVCDGYESVLTPAGLGDLTPSALDSLAPGENTANVGKLIYSNTWYYAAAVAEEEAQRISAADQGRHRRHCRRGAFRGPGGKRPVRGGAVLPGISGGDHSAAAPDGADRAAQLYGAASALRVPAAERQRKAGRILRSGQLPPVQACGNGVSGGRLCAGVRASEHRGTVNAPSRRRGHHDRRDPGRHTDIERRLTAEREAFTMSIAENIAAVRQQMDQAARETGRTGADVILVGASKMNDAAACQEAIAAGIDALGENRVQEMTAKLAENAYAGHPLHFIGHLQRNKVRQVVGKADLIQSVGSTELLQEIEKAAGRLELCQDILLEVNIGGEAAKSGFAPEDIAAAAETALAMPHVRVRGLMTIPPVAMEPHGNLAYFEKMRWLYVDINAKIYDNKMEYLSMGMSGDFADAIRCGSNMIRVGTAIFGARDYTK